MSWRLHRRRYSQAQWLCPSSSQAAGSSSNSRRWGKPGLGKARGRPGRVVCSVALTRHLPQVVPLQSILPTADSGFSLLPSASSFSASKPPPPPPPPPPHPPLPVIPSPKKKKKKHYNQRGVVQTANETSDGCGVKLWCWCCPTLVSCDISPPPSTVYVLETRSSFCQLTMFTLSQVCNLIHRKSLPRIPSGVN